MAYYIKDKSVVKSCLTDIGKKLIYDWITEKYYEPEISEESSSYIVMFQTHISGTPYKSNPVTIYTDEIMINPFSNTGGDNITKDLHDFILSVKQLVRQEKINEILQ